MKLLDLYIEYSILNGNRRGEGIQRVAQKSTIRANETPLVLPDVIDLAAHIVVAPNHIDLVLKVKRLMGHPQLVHAVQLFPCLRLDIEQVDFSIPVRVFAAYQDYLVV